MVNENRETITQEYLQRVCEKYKLVPSQTNYNFIVSQCCNLNGNLVEEKLINNIDNIRLNDKRRKNKNNKLMDKVITEAKEYLNSNNLLYKVDYEICIMSVSDSDNIIVTYVNIIIKSKDKSLIINNMVSTGWEVDKSQYISHKHNIMEAVYTVTRNSQKCDIKVTILKYRIDDILYCY